jgi:hypothetical protein
LVAGLNWEEEEDGKEGIGQWEKKLGIRPGSNPNIDTQTQFKVHSTPTETVYGLEK